MPKVLRAEAEQNLCALQDKRDRASRILSDEATAFMANPCITPKSARRFDFVLDLLKHQINRSTEMFYKRLNRKLHDMEMVQRAMGKAEDDDDMRQLLITITDCRLMEETIGIVERGVQAIHRLNGKDIQTDHDAGAKSCSSQSIAQSSNSLRSNSNNNNDNIVSGDTAAAGAIAATPAGVPMRGHHEPKVCSPVQMSHVFKLGGLGKLTSVGSAVGRAGNSNPDVGEAKLSQRQSAPDMGLRERDVAWYAGALTNRPPTKSIAVSSVARNRVGNRLQELRSRDGRSVEVAPHGGVHGVTAGYKAYGMKIGDRVPSHKRSVNCEAAVGNGAEQRVFYDSTAAAAITTADLAKRARTSGGDFGEFEQRIRLGDLLRFTAVGRPGPGQQG